MLLCQQSHFARCLRRRVRRLGDWQLVQCFPVKAKHKNSVIYGHLFFRSGGIVDVFDTRVWKSVAALKTFNETDDLYNGKCEGLYTGGKDQPSFC